MSMIEKNKAYLRENSMYFVTAGSVQFPAIRCTKFWACFRNMISLST